MSSSISTSDPRWRFRKISGGGKFHDSLAPSLISDRGIRLFEGSILGVPCYRTLSDGRYPPGRACQKPDRMGKGNSEIFREGGDAAALALVNGRAWSLQLINLRKSAGFWASSRQGKQGHIMLESPCLLQAESQSTGTVNNI